MLLKSVCLGEILWNMNNEYLLKLVDVLVLLGPNVQDIDDCLDNVQHLYRDAFWSIDLAHETVVILKPDGGC